MKTFSCALLLAVSLYLTACRDHESKPVSGEAAGKDDGGIAFKIKAGLSVPDDVARHIGLKFDGVTERKVNRQLVFTAQVYGATTGPQARRITLAAAWVDSTLAQAIPSRADITATTSDTNSLAGVVARIVPSANTNSPAEVLLELRADSGELKPGDFVRVTIALAGVQTVAAVPRSALLRTVGGDFVYIVNGKHLIRAAVTVGGEQDGFIEIKRGLLAGDKIAVAGVAMLWCAELHHVNGGDACCVPR